MKHDPDVKIFYSDRHFFIHKKRHFFVYVMYLNIASYLYGMQKKVKDV